MDNTILTIDGNNFSDFKSFVNQFNINIFGDNRTWTGGLDQLNDLLRGGYGTPNKSFTIRWLNSKKSQVDLGYEAMVEWLMKTKKNVHPTGLDLWEKRIEIAQHKGGETLFLLLVDIIIREQLIILILE